ncbi:MAG: glycosyltransferase family 4 protein [candidate division WOR-3 bacterium]
MKIVFHAVYYLPEYGGMESHIQSLAEELHKRGHEVHILCGRSLPGLTEYELINGIHVHRTTWFGRNPVGWFLYTGFSALRLLRLTRDADIVHGESFTSGWPCGLVKLFQRKPTLVTIHETRFQKFARNPLLRPGLRLLFVGVDHIFANSLPQAKAVSSLTDPTKVEPYVNACDTEIFRRVAPAITNPGKKVIICSARLVPKKGVRYAIEAMPFVLKQYPAHLYIIGEGVLRAELEQFTRACGLSDHVTFLGRRPNNEMPAYWSSGDVAVIPSFYEETSIAALEAMACETPLAASNIGGLPQLIEDRVTGRLFEPGNAQDIAEKILWLLAQDRAELGRRARERVVEKWDVRVLTNRHLVVYETLLAKCTIH